MIELKRRRKLKKKTTLHAETEKTIRALIITLSVMISVLGVASLFLNSQSSQKGHSLQQEELRQQELNRQNSNLTTQITTTKATEEVQSTINELNMQEVEDKTFVTDEDNRIN